MGRVLIESWEDSLEGGHAVESLTGPRFLAAVAPTVKPQPKRRLLEAVCEKPATKRTRRPSGKRFLAAITAE